MGNRKSAKRRKAPEWPGRDWSWMAPGTPRPQKTRRLGPGRHLVVTEGKQTEPEYFKRFWRSIRDNFTDGSCIDVHGLGCGGRQVLAKAKELNEFDPYAHVWVVYDKDRVDDDTFDGIADECRRLTEDSNLTEFHALWSNPCFEYWILLHEADIRRAMEPQEAKHEARASVGHRAGRRDRGLPEDTYDLIGARTDVARLRAVAIMEWHSGNGHRRPSQMNPGTTVHHFFEFFAKYLPA